MKYLKRHRGKILLIAVFMLLNIGLQILAPKVLSSFIDKAENGKPMEIVLLLIAGYLITVILQKLVALFENYVSSSLGWTITNELRRDALAHYINADMKQHENWSGGAMMTRLDEDVDGLYQYYFILFLKIGASTLLLLGVLVVMALQNVWLGIIMAVVSVITIYFFKVVQDIGTKRYVRSNAASAEFNGIMKDKLDNVVELHMGSAETITISEIKNAMERRFHESLPAGMMYGNLWSASTIMQIVGDIIALAAAALLWDRGMISLGTAYLLYSYVELIYNPLQEFRNHLGNLQDAKAKMLRGMEFLSVESEIQNGTSEMPECINNISVENLSFGYKEQEILHDISFKVNSGEHIGIMGETGCGKTTLVKLLARLYEYNYGRISINGSDIKGFDLEEIRKKIAYCPQKVQLMHATLRENITLFSDDFSDEAIFQAIDELNLSKWFCGFERGLDTMLESGEGSLSAGEAQFVTVIRLFLRKPEVIILDEISSRLDNESEKRLMQAISRLTEGRTVITIAHHLAALEWVDSILVIEDGRIIERGYKEVLQYDMGSRYYALLESMQNKGGILL